MHIPVLKKEVIEYLNPKPNENFIDATLGFGGHTRAILEKIKPNGKVLGIEVDPEKKVEMERLELVHDSYSNLERIVKEKYDGILFDLGFSSYEIEKSGKGFSFQKNEFLDMRYSGEGLTAYEIVNSFSEKEIEKILREYGEERKSRKIAKAILRERKKGKIKTTFQLAEIIKKEVKGGRIHPATRTFQALRIKVNDELNNLKKGLEQSLKVLKKGGKIVVISYHSLEDRIVKRFFKENNLNILTKKPIRPSLTEIRENPKSRSAKLRAAKI